MLSEDIRVVGVKHVLGFLSAMFDRDNSYSSINNKKSAVATIIYIQPYKH